MENNFFDPKKPKGNLASDAHGNLLNESPAPSETVMPYFNFVKGLGKCCMVIWVPFLFLVLITIGLIGAGAGNPAKFYNAYGSYLLFFEFSLMLISAKAIYNSKKYITAIIPFLLLIVGFAAFMIFDILA